MRLPVLLTLVVLLGCPAPRAVISTRRGPPPEGVEPGADPFAERRDVEVRPSAYVREEAARCGAAIFVGPRACFVRGARGVDAPSRPIGDSGWTELAVEVPFEYWLECGETDRPCGTDALKCVCRPP
jgi:hypothetical protein